MGCYTVCDKFVTNQIFELSLSQMVLTCDCYFSPNASMICCLLEYLDVNNGDWVMLFFVTSFGLDNSEPDMLGPPMMKGLFIAKR